MNFLGTELPDSIEIQLKAGRRGLLNYRSCSSHWIDRIQAHIIRISMSCMTVEPTPSLRWFNKAQVFDCINTNPVNMSCIVAASNSPVLGSCRSPSVVSLHDEIEICSGSPLRGSPLHHGFHTPKTPKAVRCCKDLGGCRSPRTTATLGHHEIEGGSGSSNGLVALPSPVKAKTSLFKNFTSPSSPQENLGCRNGANGLQPSFLGSRLRPVLAVKDVNHLRNEVDSSPVKKVQQRVSPVFGIGARGSDGCGDFLGKGEVCPPSRAISPPMKRKRPPRLDIPQIPGLEAPPLTKEQYPTEINMEDSHYAVACKKGRREFMEDTHKAIVNIHGDSKQAFFGVFDGHGGRKAADFAAQNIGHNIVDALAKMGDRKEDYVQAVRAGYLATDTEFLKQGVSGGTCCVTALIRDGNLVVSNAGDCRAVISRDGEAEALTCDHRAAREDERERIENLGGYVDCRHGVWRVQGVLAVSRGIGDLHMKEWISAEPDSRKIEITSDCEFLILASDGLWDKVADQEAVDLARPLCIGEQPNVESLGFFKTGEVLVENAKLPLRGPLAACRKLVELSVARGSLDDVSVMIVPLGHFCKRKNYIGDGEDEDRGSSVNPTI